MEEVDSIVLALYPNERGLGYVCLKNQKELNDFGMVSGRPITQDRLLGRINTFVAFHNPTAIVIRAEESINSRRGERVAKLAEGIVKYAEAQKIPIYRYSRQQVQDFFEVHKAVTKYQMATQIIEWFNELASVSPKVRKPWVSEDYHMGIFDALALAITHNYLSN